MTQKEKERIPKYVVSERRFDIFVVMPIDIYESSSGNWFQLNGARANGFHCTQTYCSH